MIAMYFSLVVVYFFIGYLFLPDEMCSTGFCFFGSLQFPPVVFIVTGILIRKGTIKAPPVSNTTPPEPEEGAKKTFSARRCVCRSYSIYSLQNSLLPHLERETVPDEAVGDCIVQDVVYKGVLYHLVHKGRCLHQPLLRLVDAEGFKLARYVRFISQDIGKTLHTGQGVCLVLGGPRFASLSNPRGLIRCI